ncbi:MAG: cytochrome b/b6 domain-containing protein [Gemmatimonadetes bacterium]|nr:cytochrome b/b6 domain-containing protein [Gemmatimonadota bacterium]
MDDRATAAGPHVERRHHWIVRATHWVNVVALSLMVASGLRIFNAYPAFARRGERFCCWPWEGHAAPKWLTFGGWLAGARNWHFAMMWVLALNGIAYLAFIWLHGEWRDLVPRRGDPRDAWEMVKFYLFVRKRHPHQGKHNALQKTVYFALPWLGVLAVLTGLAIWKPVELAPLTNLFGGYAWARYWHFLVMLTLVLLSLGHVFMVFAVDPQSLVSMVTGRYDESRSPEALNARPFLRQRPQPALAIARPSPAATRTGDGDARPPVPVRAGDAGASGWIAGRQEDGDAPPPVTMHEGGAGASAGIAERHGDGDVPEPPAAVPSRVPSGDGDAGDGEASDAPAMDARETGKEAGR